MDSILKAQNLLSTLAILLFAASCNWGPKTGMVELPKKSGVDKDIHEVAVVEVLQGNTYVYAKVKEGNREFWISTSKQDLKKGSSYLYSQAILKTKFKSKEHNRVFDTLFLVTTLLPKNHGQDFTKTASSSENDIPQTAIKQQFAGRVKISELITNPDAYDGQMVELKGECTKVNNAIMNRNWIHLKDGSQNDFDLVITSKEDVAQGTMITIRGIVALNKDFGSGYAYDILVEKGILVK